MEGTIVIYEPTQSLSIMGTIPTQKYVTLRATDIIKYDLKEGDRVMYDGMGHSTVFVNAKYDKETNRWKTK